MDGGEPRCPMCAQGRTASAASEGAWVSRRYRSPDHRGRRDLGVRSRPLLSGGGVVRRVLCGVSATYRAVRISVSHLISAGWEILEGVLRQLGAAEHATVCEDALGVL